MPKKEVQTAEPLLPESPTIPALKKAAADCRACDLWKTGTQTVFGEGSREATVLFIGEQPGNDEDRAGLPFVGPAGKLLDKALVQAGINRKQTYVTNVVKHFKWIPRGKLRIHSKPNAAEIRACTPWLRSEIQVIQPGIIVCLGATAAQTILGKAFRVTLQRGQFFSTDYASYTMGTIHPSAILRAPDDEARRMEMERFVDDLKKVSALLEKEFAHSH